jgi:hypothetical protein
MANGKAGAPKGNKNGVGHGRPPNPGFADKDLIDLGEELLRWMKKVDDEDLPIWHLSEWWSQIKNIPSTQWDSITRRDCFIGYYNKAKYWMGVKMISNKDFPQSYGNRFLRIYFADVRELERQDVDYEIQKKREESKVDENLLSAFNSAMNYFAEKQKENNGTKP